MNDTTRNLSAGIRPAWSVRGKYRARLKVQAPRK